MKWYNFNHEPGTYCCSLKLQYQQRQHWNLFERRHGTMYKWLKLQLCTTKGTINILCVLFSSYNCLHTSWQILDLCNPFLKYAISLLNRSVFRKGDNCNTQKLREGSDWRRSVRSQISEIPRIPRSNRRTIQKFHSRRFATNVSKYVSLCNRNNHPMWRSNGK